MGIVEKTEHVQRYFQLCGYNDNFRSRHTQKFKILRPFFNFFTPQYVIVRGVSQFFFNWNIILLVTQDHTQKFKILRQFFNFFTPQYVIVRGVGGGSRFFFDWNVILLVTQDHMQKFETLRQPLLGF